MAKSRFRIAAVCAATLAAGAVFAAPASSLVEESYLEITVYDFDTTAAEDTCIYVTDTDGAPVDSRCDVPAGEYFFTIEPGEYYIYSGYNLREPFTFNQLYDGVGTFDAAQTVTVTEGETTEVEFNLVEFPELYPDVPPSQVFYDSIAHLTTNFITTGYTDGTFRPTAPVTRQAFAAQLARFYSPTETCSYYDEDDIDTCLVWGIEDVKEDFVPEGQTFTDVPPSHPFYTEIEFLAATGIANGYEDGTFRPTAPLSRQAAASFLFALAEANALADLEEDDDYGYLEGYTESETSPFNDVSTDHQFYGAIDWLAWSEVSQGYDDGTFRPTDPVTRQALSYFLVEFFWRTDVLFYYGESDDEPIFASVDGR